MRERRSFRFLPEEIDEMGRVLEENSYSRPAQAEMEELALSFSKIRQKKGMRCVHVESIRSWFKRHRSGYIKSRIGRPPAKSARSMQGSPAAQQFCFENEKHAAEDVPSERSNSGSSEGEMSKSIKSEQGGGEPNIHDHEVTNSVDCMDATLQPVNPTQSPVTEVDGVVAKQAGYCKVQSEDGPLLIPRNCTNSDSSTLYKIGQAKAALEKLKGLSIVEYRKCKEDIKFSVKVLLEEGNELLSDTEKAELLLLPENLHKIVQENDRVRKEMSVCRAFLEKVEECEENTLKLMEKARILEEKYNAFPQNILTFSNQGDELEASIHLAKAEAEKMKTDKEDIVAQLVKIAECLQSASTHHKILKAEEASVVQKRNILTENLRKNSKEWVKLTHSKTFIA